MSEPARGGLPPKVYFRIGEVADLVGVEPHVLRYWEREFRSIRPTKSAKGQRVYSRRDVENLIRVRELLYSEGFTIAGAKKKLKHGGGENHEPVEASEPGEPEAPSASQCSASPAADPSCTEPSATRKQLLAIREDIEAFLADLSSSAVVTGAAGARGDGGGG